MRCVIGEIQEKWFFASFLDEAHRSIGQSICQIAVYPGGTSVRIQRQILNTWACDINAEVVVRRRR